MKRGARLAAAALVAALLAAAPASAATFTNPNPIAIPDGSGAPSTIGVTGLDGPVTDVNVTLNDLTHGRPDDIDLALVSPSETRLYLMSDACGPELLPAPIDVTFDDDAPAGLSDEGPCASGTYDPTDHEPGAVGEPFADYPALNGFNGEVASGTWRLEVVDDAAGQTGSINGGWSITITSGGAPPITISSGSQAFGAASPFPAELDVLGEDQVVITDLDVRLDGVSHQDADHIDMFLEGPGGERSWLMSDVCPGGHKLAEWEADDEAAQPFNTAEACASGTYRPTNHDQGGFDFDSFPAGAPPVPAATSLTTFDLTDPDGTWRLWIQDDEEGRAGFVADGWSLDMTTRPAADVGFVVASQIAPEGSTVVVDVLRGAGAAALGRGSVVVATSSGTAEAGADFFPVSQILTFEPGETRKSVAVPVLSDGGLEPQQDFSIVLGLTEGDAKVGTPGAVGVTIPADAQQPPPDLPTGNEDKPPPGAFDRTNVFRSAPRARRCFRRGARIQFRPQMPQGVAIVRSEVYVNGRKIEDNVGVSAVAPINVTMTRKRIRIRIRLHSHDGRVVTVRRTFRRCKRR